MEMPDPPGSYFCWRCEKAKAFLQDELVCFSLSPALQ